MSCALQYLSIGLCWGEVPQEWRGTHKALLMWHKKCIQGLTQRKQTHNLLGTAWLQLICGDSALVFPCSGLKSGFRGVSQRRNELDNLQAMVRHNPWAGRKLLGPQKVLGGKRAEESDCVVLYRADSNRGYAEWAGLDGLCSAFFP